MDKKRILVCEDDERFQDALVQLLETANFLVWRTGDGQSCLARARREKPDLIMLDVNLPDMDGFQICKILKSGDDTAAIPIIMLTSRAAHLHMIEGLELGADDYITKPIVPGVVLARIAAVLRRGGSAPGSESVFVCGDITLDLARHSCTRKKKEIHLLPKEFEVLALLMKQPGKVLARNYILQVIWGQDPLIPSRTVDTTIARLRSKLGPEKRRIETVQTIGYRITESAKK